MTNWNKFDSLVGNPLSDIPLNSILIKANQFIYSMKMKKSFPGCVEFKTLCFISFIQRNTSQKEFYIRLMRNGITIKYYYSNL